MSRQRHALVFPVLIASIGLLAGLPSVSPTHAQDAPPETTEAEAEAYAAIVAAEEKAAIEAELARMSPAERLALEVAVLNDVIQELRAELARTRLEREESRRELDELRQFISDHREFGQDFARYQGIKLLTERDERQRAGDAARAQRDADRDMRRQRQLDARAERDARRVEQDRESRYSDAGFAPLGLDVFGGRMAYFYVDKNSGGPQIEYDSFLGLYYRPTGTTGEIDFSKMKISGAILNASDEVRNLGIAITFFDDLGNQVGSEIVQIENARPDVPYPFNATLDMALDRPFASSSTYVLYADPIAPPTDG